MSMALYSIKEPYKSDFESFNDDGFYEEDVYVSELWKNILLKYGDQCVLTLRYKESMTEQVRHFVRQFTNILDETYERYTRLLKLYNDEKANLMAKLETISTGTGTGEEEQRFNDTPQVEDDGSVPTDKYLTTYTKNNSKSKSKSLTLTDPATIMSRLNEISALYRDLMSDWTNEFRSLFWPTGVSDYVSEDD